MMRGIRITFMMLCVALSLATVPTARGEAVLRIPAQGTLELAFSPDDNTQDVILRALEGARKTVWVQAYSFTDREITAALIRAQRRGVQVQVILDADQALRLPGSQLETLAAAHIPVWLDGAHRISHNKIMLIDPNETYGAVITGSYNFTHSARTANSENLLLLRGNTALNRAYAGNWQRHRAHSLPYPPQPPSHPHP